MIIEFTLFNNNYTQIIQKYFDEGGPFVSTFYNSETEYRKFLKDVKELNKFRYFLAEKKELKKHLEEKIKQNFINYINSIDENSKWKTKVYSAKKMQKHKEDILKRINVRLKNLIFDMPKNNEFVYYFDYLREYITF
ncbi:MAG: hypothetical protein ACLTKT_08160 [Clostridia bacterium]